MDLQEYRETSLQTWDEMAPGWEDRREWLLGITGAINEWLVDRVDPQPGQTILDIAAGTGDLGFAAAARVGEERRGDLHRLRPRDDRGRPPQRRAQRASTTSSTGSSTPSAWTWAMTASTASSAAGATC